MLILIILWKRLVSEFLCWVKYFCWTVFFVSGDVSQMSAEEYLSWVRYYKSFYKITTKYYFVCFRHQASQLPDVFRANITTKIPTRQSKYMPTVEDIMQCPQEYLPNEDWEIDILHSFSQLRNVSICYFTDQIWLLSTDHWTVERFWVFSWTRFDCSSDERH